MRTIAKRTSATIIMRTARSIDDCSLRLERKMTDAFGPRPGREDTPMLETRRHEDGTDIHRTRREAPSGSGRRAFPAIMDAVERLTPGQGLRLLAPFRPQPLFSAMARKGFVHQVSELANGDFEVTFMPRATEIFASDDVRNVDEWPEPTRYFDLSESDPPKPMDRILSEIDTMAPGEVLFAVLATEPLALFQELTRRGHQWAGNYDTAGTSFRIMVKRGASDA